MQVRALLAIGLAILTACGPAAVPQAPSPSAAASTAPSASPRDTGRETLAANDGWASATTGTSGGAKADAARVKTVADRQQLVAALGDPTDAAAKIVYVKGTIDGNVDEANKPLRCDDYATSGYTLDAYLKAFDPAVWGRTKRPSGALEEARVASQKKQAARVQVKVSANTTIVGVGGARLVGLNLVLDQVDNVIIRDLTFIDAYDCFPQWDPTDGSQGNWNSQYDNISLNGATHVWIDHNAFGDGEHPDAKQPTYLGRPYQSHDGALDIAKASDMVTVSWNRFADHDKVMLIGSSDTATADAGKLNVTIHHNGFSGVGQRTPRVRFGKVDVYDNLYEIPNAAGYTYSWGVGIEGKLYAENNVVRLGAGVAPDRFIRAFGGKSIRATGTLVDDGTKRTVADMLASYNAANDAKLTDDVGWTPSLRLALDKAEDIASLVAQRAGPRS
ncbi:MAG: pectate lyase [Chloroflexi bacterium 13_1_40CM_4_68_4]|nr:MAG: pectate lyase [Chloroflexi bacterium 13_1_40CM_4_68_4]